MSSTDITRDAPLLGKFKLPQKSSWASTMVDYSKFNNIEGASDSDDDQKTTVDPDKAEAWLRKYDELAKDQSSDSDSDSDEPTTPASTGRRRAPRASDPTSTTPLTKTRRQAQGPDPRRRDVADLAERRRSCARAGPDGRIIRGEQLPPDLKDAEYGPRSYTTPERTAAPGRRCHCMLTPG